jgi:hypothetical protein
MASRRLLPALVALPLVMGGGAIGASIAGCELIVRIDQSLVDASEDAGCPICSDAGGAEGNDGGDVDAQGPETSVDSAGMDGGAESATDSAGSGGG